MAKGGAKVWYFPDGQLPAKGSGSALEAHEALMLLNVTNQPADVKLDFYFELNPPIKDVTVSVGAERVICIRLDHPKELGGVELPRMVQYAMRVRSNVSIVAQFGRLDTTQPNLAYYVAPTYCEDE